MTAPGKFITLEGGEGAGKSTLAKGLIDELLKAGVRVELTREPGGTEFANKVRQLLVEKQADDIDAMTEALLVNAARRHHLQKKIIPRLNEGVWVLCDRFIDSTFVYQGMVQTVPLDFLERLHAQTCFDLYPDMALLLDLPAHIGLARTQQREGSENEQRFEAKGSAFHEAVRSGFLTRAKQHDRIHTIDATQSAEQILQDSISALRSQLGLFA